MPKRWVHLYRLEIQPLQYLQSVKFFTELFLQAVLVLPFGPACAALVGTAFEREMASKCLLIYSCRILETWGCGYFWVPWWNANIIPLCTNFSGSRIRACFQHRGFLELGERRSCGMFGVSAAVCWRCPELMVSVRGWVWRRSLFLHSSGRAAFPFTCRLSMPPFPDSSALLLWEEK